MTYIDSRKTPAEELARLAAKPSDELARAILNDELNGFIAHRSSSSFSDDREDAPIPYQGWFWRSVDFFTPRGVTIAEGDGQVGVCENNKWDYPERWLTDDEQAEFLRLVWAAYQESRKGGNLADINEATDAALRVAGEYIAGLDVGESR